MHVQRPSGMKNVDRLIYAAPFKDNWTQLFNVKLLGLSYRVQSHNRFCISEFVSLSNRETSKPSVVWLKSFLSTYPGWRVATGHTCFTAVISLFDPSSSQSCAVGELHVFVCTFAPSFRKETSQPQHFRPFGTMCTAWAWIFTFSGAKAEVWAVLITNTQDALLEYITNVLTAVRELHRWQTQTLNYKCSHEQMSGHGWATETSAERQKNPVSTCGKAQGVKLSLFFSVNS